MLIIFILVVNYFLMEHQVGFEPTMTVLQTAPLGHLGTDAMSVVSKTGLEPATLSFVSICSNSN